MFLPVSHSGFPIYEIGWTLNFEMLFYCIFAATLVLGMRAAVFTLIVLFVIIATIGNFITLILPFSVWSNPIILEFVMGAALGVVFETGARLPMPAVMALGLGGLLLFEIGAQFGYYATPLNDPLFPRFLAWGCPALLIVSAAVLSSKKSRPSWIGMIAWHLGNASYSIYLVHAIWILYMSQWFGSSIKDAISTFLLSINIKNIDYICEAIIAFILLVSVGVVSSVVYSNFELPCKKRLIKLLFPGKKGVDIEARALVR